jgi:hypothetical protein
MKVSKPLFTVTLVPLTMPSSKLISSARISHKLRRMSEQTLWEGVDASLRVAGSTFLGSQQQHATYAGPDIVLSNRDQSSVCFDQSSPRFRSSLLSKSATWIDEVGPIQNRAALALRLGAVGWSSFVWPCADFPPIWTAADSLGLWR